MCTIQWVAADVDVTIADRLTRFDHHRIDIEGESAVLMTYLRPADPHRRLYAVMHPAADTYSAVPNWAHEELTQVAWQPCDAPY